MRFLYPRACNWILHKRNRDGTYTLKDCLCGCEYTLGPTIGFLWRNLDGRTDPGTILPNCSQYEVSAMMDSLEKEELIRHSRVLDKSKGSITYSLIVPARHTRRSCLPVLFNYLLLVFWFPVLVIGIHYFTNSLSLFDSSYMFLGQLVGLLVGCVGHESGHTIVALAYGAGFMEAGVLIQHGLPGAYVLLDDSHVKRLPKVQIHAGGVEVNFLIAGIALMLATICSSFYGFFFGVALNNLLLGLINLTFIDSLDGMHIIETLLGYKPLEMIKSKAMRDALVREGLPGKLELSICYILKAMQLVYPVLLTLNVMEVVLWLILIV